MILHELQAWNVVYRSRLCKFNTAMTVNIIRRPHSPYKSQLAHEVVDFEKKKSEG